MRAFNRARSRGDLDDWVVPTTTQTLRLLAQRTHALTYQYRPTRRTFLDSEDTTTRAYLARTRRRPKRWGFTAPDDLEPEAVLLCLWLVHLLDIHALLGQAWESPGPSWSRSPTSSRSGSAPAASVTPDPRPARGTAAALVAAATEGRCVE